ncbi:RadC family protein [Paraburkholderia sediminicola]|uniref:RadC family protein n=1 Tax=Paraburkholderia sediminicola TaxID=458836 RepID=UPI0020B1737A
MADHACTIDETPPEAAPPQPAPSAAAAPALSPPRSPAVPRNAVSPQSVGPAPGVAVAATLAGRRPARKLVRGKWLKHDMPRERLIEKGPSALSDTEMIVLVLGAGLPGHDVFDVARTLLNRFGSLRAMLDASYADFDGLRGIGPAKKAQLLAIMEMARRSLVDKLRERSLMNSPEAVEDYLRLRIGGSPHEVFMSLFLDARHRLIHCEESARGTLTRMAVHPREIVRRALSLNAASLIVAHNHPSGAVQPSASDCRLTHTLRDALALIDVQLIDHLVISADRTYSFARAGWP